MLSQPTENQDDLSSDLDQSDQQELFEHFRFEVDRKQGLLRIDKYLHNRVENSSRTKIQAVADAGNIMVNGKSVKSNYKVKPGDTITVLLTSEPREIEVVPQDIPIDVVYEDDHILVVNKAAGMVVHPAYGNYTGTLVNAIAWRIKDSPLFKKGELRPGIVHRIDKNTSGIMLVAKNELALNKLAKQFYDRTIDRRYIAIVWGNLKEDTGTITGHVGRNIYDRKLMAVYTDGSQGKHAVTHYKVIERLQHVNIVECKLETGRTHQIRVHFKHIGHPLFGDFEYGGDKILRGINTNHYHQFVGNCFLICPRQALHAKSLEFTHPITSNRMSFNSDLPSDMSILIEKWRNFFNNINQ